MIDEEMNVPRGSDDTYLNKVRPRMGGTHGFWTSSTGCLAGMNT